MPPPGEEPPWLEFFPLGAESPLAGLLRARYDAYVGAVRQQLVDPSFGRVDRLVVLVDLLSALHGGPAAFADAVAALAEVAEALRWSGSSLLPDWLTALLGYGISRVAFAATKSNHVADRQRGNLAALAAAVTRLPPRSGLQTEAFAVSSVRCTEDVVWTLDGHPVSAVRGRVAGAERAGRSYPGASAGHGAVLIVDFAIHMAAIRIGHEMRGLFAKRVAPRHKGKTAGRRRAASCAKTAARVNLHKIAFMSRQEAAEGQRLGGGAFSNNNCDSMRCKPGTSIKPCTAAPSSIISFEGSA